MALIAKESQISSSRAPWRGAVAGTVGAIVFIVGLAFVARATRDDAGAVPQPERVFVDAGTPVVVVDAGVVAADADAAEADAGAADAGEADAGHADAGEVVGPEVEPDTGPAVVEGPPIVAADVVAVVVPLVEECLKRALRFDPALGGRVRITIVVGGGRLVPTLAQSPSPVLSSCIATGGSALAWPTEPGERHLVEAKLALDGLRGAVRVESAELVHVPE